MAVKAVDQTSYLQQLLVGKRQDALEDDHIGAVHRLLQAHMEAFSHINQTSKGSRLCQSLNQKRLNSKRKKKRETTESSSNSSQMFQVSLALF